MKTYAHLNGSGNFPPASLTSIKIAFGHSPRVIRKNAAPCKSKYRPTHLPAAAGLRIRALGRPPTPISLVNVPFVFHHGHHKRHLVGSYYLVSVSRVVCSPRPFLYFLGSVSPRLSVALGLESFNSSPRRSERESRSSH